MNTDRREQIIQLIEQRFMQSGAESYDHAMQTLGKLLEHLQKHYDPMRTKDQFRKALDQMPDPYSANETFSRGIEIYATNYSFRDQAYVNGRGDDLTKNSHGTTRHRASRKSPDRQFRRRSTQTRDFT